MKPLQGTHIKASILKHLIPKFSDYIEEGRVYTLTSFKVEEQKESYRPVSNIYKILFIPETSIKREDSDFPTIKDHKFDFVPYTDVKSRQGNDLYLSGMFFVTINLHSLQINNNTYTNTHLRRCSWHSKSD